MGPIKYKVLEKSLIGNQLFEAGDIAEYEGLPSGNLEPLCDEGRKRQEQFLREDNERRKKMIGSFSETSEAQDLMAAMRELVKSMKEAQQHAARK